MPLEADRALVTTGNRSMARLFGAGLALSESRQASGAQVACPCFRQSVYMHAMSFQSPHADALRADP